MKREWTTISSGQTEDHGMDTAVMEVPGGVVMRYRMHASYNGNPTVSMVFIPGAKLSDFEKEVKL